MIVSYHATMYRNASQLLQAEMGRLAAVSLLELYPQATVDLPAELLLPQNARIRHVAEYVHEHAHLPITSTDLAVLANLSLRALQVAFNRVLGMFPNPYIRQVRLDRVRSELLAADPAATNVSDVARFWGFAHAGGFSAAYAGVSASTPASRCTADTADTADAADAADAAVPDSTGETSDAEDGEEMSDPHTPVGEQDTREVEMGEHDAGTPTSRPEPVRAAAAGSHPDRAMATLPGLYDGRRWYSRATDSPYSYRYVAAGDEALTLRRSQMSGFIRVRSRPATTTSCSESTPAPPSSTWAATTSPSSYTSHCCSLQTGSSCSRSRTTTNA
ncbi:AraC family transcriptional regulator [Curtobacterium sp. MCBD17_023]|uniref:helix-turn-helix domain-containing protein n=1 Tax=Curtobacterium sp. MCBD17_023 TaxID=2175657 RepID=UPI000D82D87B|nr:AraC family transcriptional regulator [Curtobacterium sp. MCBD17_023]PYY46090.1 hypothetical protein DEI84_13185 [Curtobacterium sp. MCBD17_023]